MSRCPACSIILHPPPDLDDAYIAGAVEQEAGEVASQLCSLHEKKRAIFKRILQSETVVVSSKVSS